MKSLMCPDRIVFAGGLIAVLCTGFFGAEPPSAEHLSSLHTIPYIQTQCAAPMPRAGCADSHPHP